MSDTYDLLPELSLEFGNALKPELEQMLLFQKEDKICMRMVFSKLSGILGEDEDLSYVIDKSNEPVFSTDYTLESNAMLFLSLEKLSLLMIIGDAFTKEGIELLLES